MEENLELEHDNKLKPSVIGMFTDPVEQFRRMKANPAMLIGLIVIFVLGVLSAILSMSFVEGLIADELATLSDDEARILIGFTKVVTVITGLLAPFLGVLIQALVFFVIAKIAQSVVSFKQVFTMSVFIAIITLVGGTLNNLTLFALDIDTPGVVVTSLQSIVQAGGALGALLSTIEIFSIWTLILTAIGMQIVIGLSKKVSWILVITYFVVTALIAMGSVALLDSLNMFM